MARCGGRVLAGGGITCQRLHHPSYEERSRCGEALATRFAESRLNQLVSKRFCGRQQMPWSKRNAHLRLPTRVKTLNHQSGSVFKQWNPNLQGEGLAEAA
jgi:hypothetical protein